MITYNGNTTIIRRQEVVDLLFDNFDVDKEAFLQSLPNRAVFTPQEAAYLPQNHLTVDEFRSWHNIIKMHYESEVNKPNSESSQATRLYSYTYPFSKNDILEIANKVFSGYGYPQLKAALSKNAHDWLSKEEVLLTASVVLALREDQVVQLDKALDAHTKPSLKQSILNRFQKRYILTEEDLASIVKEFLDLPEAEVNFYPNEQNKPVAIITEG